MKPKYRQMLATVTVVLSLPTALHAADNFWDGSESSAWNDPLNWSANVVPTKTPGAYDAIVNTNTPNIATISVDVLTPEDIFVGRGAGVAARLDHTAGSAGTGNTNYMLVGSDGGSGTYNLANTAGTGGATTGFAQGSGVMNVSGRLYIGGYNGTGSTGVVNVNTSENVNVGGALEIGTNAATGTLNLDSGTVTTGDWTEIGNGAGSAVGSSKGYLNMSGGTLAKGGTNNLIIGANGAIGVAEVTGGVVSSNNEIWIGNGAGSNGTLNLSGTAEVTSGSAFTIGRATATGKVVMTGGKITKTGGGHFSVGGTGIAGGTEGGIGTLEQSGGDINDNNEFWVGNAAGSVGIYNFSGGTLTNGSYVAVGRAGGTGTVTMTGGTWSKTGGGFFIIGASGPGTMNMSGGIVTVASPSLVWLGEQGTTTGNLTLSGSADFKTDTAKLGLGGNTIGNLTLNGGTLRIGQIQGGSGTANVIFNGTQIVAQSAQGAFLDNLDTASISIGGLKIDSQAFTVATAQNLTGTGGLVKTGAGQLTLTGANDYSGETQIQVGTLAVNADGSSGHNYSVSDGARFNAVVTAAGDQIQIDKLTVGATTGATLVADLGSTGNPSVAPFLANTLQINGVNELNLAATALTVGPVPLITYTTRTGTGTFIKGALPRGVQADIVETPGQVALNITRIANLYWEGKASAYWNTTEANWYELLNATGGHFFQNGDPVTFDDLGTVKDVILDVTVQPESTNFDNFGSNYTLTGTGSIAGTGGLVKTGTGTVSISTANSYTGVTAINGGVLSVPSLGSTVGAPSPLGAVSADPAKLLLGGGTLAYTGAAATTTVRGLTVAGDNSTISNTSGDLTIAGPIVSTSGGLGKSGVGNLILTNPTNVIGAGAYAGLAVHAGTLTFSGGGTQINTIAGEMWVGDAADTAGNLVLNQTTLRVAGFLAVGRGNGSTGLVSTVTATGSTIETGNFSSGYAGGIAGDIHKSTQNITLNNSTWTNSGQSIIGESGGGSTNFTLNGNSVYSGAGTIHIARSGPLTTFAVNDTSVLEGKGFISLGRYAGAEGILNVNGGTVTQSGVDQRFIVGEDGKGTLNVNSGSVTVLGDSLVVAANPGAVGTVNLKTGGLLQTKVVVEGAVGGTSAFNFDGGTLRAGASTATFMATMDTAAISANGGTIDTNGNEVVVAQAFTGAGGLTKTGAGNLALNGANLYTGKTTVANGGLGGTGSLAGELVVNSGAKVSPGVGIGALTAAKATFKTGSNLTIEINDLDGAVNDELVVTGNLDITGAALQVSAVGTPAMLPYTIATFGSRTGTFASVPAGVTVSYNANSITLTAVPAASGFDEFIAGVPGIDGQRGRANDPDRDGQSNIAEYALGGMPNSGANNAKIFGMVADSDDAGTEKELLMTIAVLQGTPAFTGSPLSATMNGLTYVIEGSMTLAGFPLAATPVGPVAPPAPDATAPAGYEYRTFSLNGSNGTPAKGFLRVSVKY